MAAGEGRIGTLFSACGARRWRWAASGQARAGTLSSHHGHVFAAELTAEEMESLRRQAAAGVASGVTADSEQTYLEVVTVGRLLEQGLADWATVGMVLQALLPAKGEGQFSGGSRRPEPPHLVRAGRGFEGREDGLEFLFLVNLLDLGHQLKPLFPEPNLQGCFDAPA
jgi:hypothetical protein